MADDAPSDPFGSFLTGFRKSRAAKMEREKAEAAQVRAPALARVAPAEYQATPRELAAQEDYLTRVRVAHEGRPGALEAAPTPSTEQMTGGGAPGPAADYSMAAMRRVPILTSPAVVPNRATPAEMDAMSNADFLAARGREPPPDESPYRQGNFVRTVEPEANPYGPNPYK